MDGVFFSYGWVGIRSVFSPIPASRSSETLVVQQSPVREHQDTTPPGHCIAMITADWSIAND